MNQPASTEQSPGTVYLSSDGVYRGFAVQKLFPLNEAQFLRLTKVTSFFPIWFNTLLTATVALFITVLAKFVDQKYFGGQSEVTAIDLIALGIVLFFTFVLILVSRWVPTDRKKTISEIEKHFRDNPPHPAGLQQ